MNRGLFTDKIDKLKLHGGTIKYFNIFVNIIRKIISFRLCIQLPCSRKVSDALQSCTVVVIPVILVDGTQNA